MRLKKFEIAKIVFSINAAFSTNFINEKKKTKKFVRNRENDILTIDFFFSSRFRNIKRRHLFFFSSSSTNAERERFNKNNSIDESINNRVETIKFESFFVFQSEHKNENENVFFKQQLNDFSFDDEIIQNVVFFSIEKHEIVTNVDFRDNDENRVSNSSRQVTIEKKSSSLFSTFF